MPVKVLAFGRISEITGREFNVDAQDSDALETEIANRFPAIADARFAIAVNRRTISGFTAFSDSDEIALMSPYSGG